VVSLLTPSKQQGKKVYILTIHGQVQRTERNYDDRTRALRGFYSAVYNNSPARVTLTDPDGEVIRIGAMGRTTSKGENDE
jgi:hypothetical protein